MQRATISQLRNGLSAYLRKVLAGEPLIVLDRDRPIARLERIHPGDLPDARLAALEREGVIRRPAERLDLERLRAQPPRPTSSAVDALIEERREGR